MKVAFHTLGCKVNQYETEAMKEAFVSRGAEIVGEEEPADVYVVNTCTVTNIADRKSRQYIRRMHALNPDALMVVTGCYAQVSEDALAKMPEVDLIVGNSLKSGIADAVYEALEKTDRMDPEKRGAVFPIRDVLSYDELTFYDDMGIVTAEESYMSRAYIKIQEGCDRFCSYCMIPYARGPVRSRPAEEVVEEVRTLVAAGYREVVLTGINTALYGTEEGADCTLSELLTMLDGLEVSGGDFRIRLSSLEPTVVDKDNVEKIVDHKRLCHHLHLSVQSGSNSVLRSMNRHYTREDYLDIVRMLRSYDPLFGITTDIIVGFPGETENDFEDSLDIVAQAGFGRTHVFRYSPRKGTAGARMKDQINDTAKKQRAAALEEKGGRIEREFIEANRDAVHEVLVEERADGYATGYTGNYIRVYIDDPDECLKPGTLVKAAVRAAFRNGALAELCDPEP